MSNSLFDLDVMPGLAQPVDVVLRTLDKNDRNKGRPDVWFLPLDEPISPYLDELLGPINSGEADGRTE